MSDASNKESIARTLLVAFLVCLVCSLVVAGAALGLKDAQAVNSQLNKQRSILSIAAEAPESTPNAEVQRLFKERIQARIVDLDEARFSDDQDPATYDAAKALQDASLSRDLTAAEDIASIHRRERYATVYTVEEGGALKTLILPVRGYGLWSTLYGFIALKSDLNTVAGLGFYQQAETAGLGGEVDNPRWKALWPGKLAFNAAGDPDIHVIKGNVDAANPNAAHQVDGLAGATLTSKGVQHMLDFWLGQQGFGPFLANLRQGAAQAAAAQPAPAPQPEPEAAQPQPEPQPQAEPAQPQPELAAQPAAVQPEALQPEAPIETPQPEAPPHVLPPEAQGAEDAAALAPPEARPDAPQGAEGAQPEEDPQGVRPDLLRPGVNEVPEAQLESEET